MVVCLSMNCFRLNEHNSSDMIMFEIVKFIMVFIRMCSIISLVIDIS